MEYFQLMADQVNPDVFKCSFLCPNCSSFIDADTIEYEIICPTCSIEFYITVTTNTENDKDSTTLEDDTDEKTI